MPSGSRVGAWRVLRVIGRGGMGDVYLAERADASFDKQVALKLVQGMLTPVARLRFEAEKQALARLEHPNIARLIDAGESSVGWPYLVMEYVDGVSLDESLSGQSIESILAIFLQVCDALAYAHRQLVLHRDIKPSNILVDRDGHAKLLDFGVAKLLQSAEGAEESATIERSYTPDYASPEQVFGRPIGVASDVYSMGVLLYRLLTGVPPYRVTGDTADLVHALTQAQVALPSRAVLGDTQTQTSDRRKRARQLHGDLDTVLLKALQKLPERRYASVDAFADDLRRYLENKPIHARPDAFWYRTGKFMQRNTIAVVAATAVMLALVLGLAGSLWQAHIANQQRVLAERRFEDVRSLAHAMIFDLHDAIAKLPGSTTARELLVKEALTYLQRLGEEGEPTPALRRELAEAWLRIGDVQGRPMDANLGDIKGALASYAKASELIGPVLRSSPNDRDAQLAQAQILLHRADVEFQTSDLESAGKDYRASAALWRALAAQGVPSAQYGLASALMGVGDYLFWTEKLDDSLKQYEAASAIAIADHTSNPRMHTLQLAALETRRGDTLDWLDRYPEGRVLLQHSLTLLEPLRKAGPRDAQALHSIAVTNVKLGENFQATDPDQMLAAFDKAQDALRTLSDADPADMNAKRLLGLSYNKLGDALLDLKRYDEGLARYNKALVINQMLVTSDPRNQDARRDLANNFNRIAMLELDRKRPAAAVKPLQEALALRTAIYKLTPEMTNARRDMALVNQFLAQAVTDPAEQCANWRRAEDFWQGLIADGKQAATDKVLIEEARTHAVACH